MPAAKATTSMRRGRFGCCTSFMTWAGAGIRNCCTQLPKMSGPKKLRIPHLAKRRKSQPALPARVCFLLCQQHVPKAGSTLALRTYYSDDDTVHSDDRRINTAAAATATTATTSASASASTTTSTTTAETAAVLVHMVAVDGRYYCSF